MGPIFTLKRQTLWDQSSSIKGAVLRENFDQ